MSNSDVARKLHAIANTLTLRADEFAALAETASKEELLAQLNKLHESLTQLLDSELFES